MAANAQTNLTNRQYYAAHGRFSEVQPWFKHAVTTGKPPYPDASSLTGQDATDFSAWLTSRENGGQASAFIAPAYSAATQAMISTYETYFASSQYTAWAHDDLVSRQMQWRLRCADILHAIEQGGVVPVSADPNGVGKNAPTYPIGLAAASNTSDTFDTGSGNEPIPTGATSLVIEAWGGGGGGQRAASSPKGGGSGAYVKKTITIAAADWGANIAYVVGAGGAGTNVNGNGTSGSASTVGSNTITAGTINLSAGGGASGGTGGAGGTATGGDINTAGSAGTTSGGGYTSGYGGGLGGANGANGNSPSGGGGPSISGTSGNGANGRVKFTWTF